MSRLEIDDIFIPVSHHKIEEDMGGIPVEELIDILKCRELKKKYVREQNYDAAAEIRDKEKVFYLKYPKILIKFFSY